MEVQATIVSILPFTISEAKPGLYPGNFIIPGAKLGSLEVLVIGDSVHYVYMDKDRGSLAVKTSAYDVARSICNDFSEAQLAVTDIARPGLFWVPGSFVPDQIKAKFESELQTARKGQAAWFERLIKLADDDWSRYHQHKMISDLQRYAADALGQHRDWTVKLKDIVITDCPFCRSKIPAAAVVCPTCAQVVDQVRYNQLKNPEPVLASKK